MRDKHSTPRSGSVDLRKYAKQTNVRLAVGAFLLVFVIGVALIWVFYGGGAAGMGLVCLLAALLPIALIILFFLTIEWILKRARPE